MSSIIDALKKSDQSRNNDGNHTLNNINFSEQPQGRSRRGFWLLVILLLLIALGVYGWQQGWHQHLISMVSTNERPADTPVQQPGKDVVDSQAAGKPATRPEPVNKLTPPKQQDIKARSQQITSQQTTEQPPTAQPGKQTAETAESTYSEPATLTVVENRTATSPPADTAEKGAADTKSTTGKPNASQPADQGLQPQLKQDHLYLHQLDYAVRKNIPEVKISIHIYDPEPDNRMLMINGEKFAIGDRIEDLLTIHDIVPEGVVLAYENIRFLLPK